LRYINVLVFLLYISFVLSSMAQSISDKKVGHYYTGLPIFSELKINSKEKLAIKPNLASLTSVNAHPKIKKTKEEVIYNDKSDVVNKDQVHNQRRYYKPNYVKSHSRYCDPYWRKPFKSISFGIDI
jgi:hypothetical protein